MRRIAALLFLVPITAAGCGGGSTETATHMETRMSPAPPSKADFISHADAICHNHASRREDLESQANELGPLDAKDAHRVADLLREASDNLRAEAQELQALRPPPAGAGALGPLVSIVGVQASVLDRWAEAYDDLNPAAIRRRQLRVAQVNTKADRIAQGYGFEVCARV